VVGAGGGDRSSSHAENDNRQEDRRSHGSAPWSDAAVGRAALAWRCPPIESLAVS
jgi:hypothetical protein